MSKNVLSVKILPISEEVRRKENRWAWVASFFFFLLACGNTYSIRTDTVSVSNISFFGILCGFLSVGIFLILIFDEDDSGALSRRFMDAFGIDPEENHDKVQNVINSVLLSMWRSYDGCVQREVNAECDHMSIMTAKSAAYLAKMRKERVDAVEPIKAAAGWAIDWRYEVPEAIKQFIK